MDLAKIDRMHAALSATLVVTSTDQQATPPEVLCAAMRLFSHWLATSVYEEDTAYTVMRSEIENHCRAAVAMATGHLLTIRGRALGEEDEEEDG